jgi:hypothetical protein
VLLRNLLVEAEYLVIELGGLCKVSLADVFISVLDYLEALAEERAAFGLVEFFCYFIEQLP